MQEPHAKDAKDAKGSGISPQTPNLPLFLLHKEDPNVHWLLKLLAERGWMTRKQILAHLQWPATEHNLRWVRALAEAAGQRRPGPDIIKGQKGFNHVSNCTTDEITHSANQSIAQGKLMVHYGIALRRRAHQLIGKS